MKKTPLYDVHCELGGRIVDFAGWALPVQYSGIVEEHDAVRNSAGLFDVSHMGEIAVKGEDAKEFIQRMVTNDISILKDGHVVYSLLCYPDGGVVDDLLIYKLDDEEYLLVVNASNTDKDLMWLQDNVIGRVKIANVSSDYAQLALQGPLAEAILQKLADICLKKLKFFNFNNQVHIKGVKVLVSRTGYTGEDGFEIYLPCKDARFVWDILMDAGKAEGLKPCGLGARDTLRFEAALPLYGHEISQDISPLEAGLDRFVKMDKGDFIGLKALANQKEKGIAKKLAGFEMIDKGIPRSGYEVIADGKKVGFVTSGSFSPSLKKNLGMAMLDIKYAKAGTEIYIVVRNNPLKARVVNLPFYEKRYKNKY